jgi:mismatch-specific thymine-DNA glycosylase
MSLKPRLLGNQAVVSVRGQEVLTLRDILPPAPRTRLRLLFVAKTPAPESVAAGHYFQGRHGANFWSALKAYDLLKATTQFEDDSLLDHGFGLTDIVKVPRAFGTEPSAMEYKVGSSRILELIRRHHPRVVVFVYKRVLDKILHSELGRKSVSTYGFNPDLEGDFGARVFALPLPGVGGCTTAQIRVAMEELRDDLVFNTSG